MAEANIPRFRAERAAVPGTYDPLRRPGSSGQRYFSDMQYANPNMAPRVFEDDKAGYETQAAYDTRFNNSMDAAVNAARATNTAQANQFGLANLANPARGTRPSAQTLSDAEVRQTFADIYDNPAYDTDRRVIEQGIGAMNQYNISPQRASELMNVPLADIRAMMSPYYTTLGEANSEGITNLLGQEGLYENANNATQVQESQELNLANSPNIWGEASAMDTSSETTAENQQALGSQALYEALMENAYNIGNETTGTYGSSETTTGGTASGTYTGDAEYIVTNQDENFVRNYTGDPADFTPQNEGEQLSRRYLGNNKVEYFDVNDIRGVGGAAQEGIDLARSGEQLDWINMSLQDPTVRGYLSASAGWTPTEVQGDDNAQLLQAIFNANVNAMDSPSNAESQASQLRGFGAEYNSFARMINETPFAGEVYSQLKNIMPEYFSNGQSMESFIRRAKDFGGSGAAGAAKTIDFYLRQITAKANGAITTGDTTDYAPMRSQLSALQAGYMVRGAQEEGITQSQYMENMDNTTSVRTTRQQQIYGGPGRYGLVLNNDVQTPDRLHSVTIIDPYGNRTRTYLLRSDQKEEAIKYITELGVDAEGMRNALAGWENNAAFPNDSSYAQGGIASVAPQRQGYYLGGATDGMADQIPATIDNRQPAALSDGEFVIPADVVSHLGNGNSSAGATQLHGMLDKVRQARTGSTEQGRQINPNKFLA